MLVYACAAAHTVIYQGIHTVLFPAASELKTINIPHVFLAGVAHACGSTCLCLDRRIFVGAHASRSAYLILRPAFMYATIYEDRCVGSIESAESAESADYVLQLPEITSG